jgi:acetoin utilization deacetylase AcuC-like enzyme
MIAFAGDRHLLHDPPYAFVRGALAKPFERPGRVAHLRAALDDLGIVVRQPADHDIADLLAVHDRQLVDFLRLGFADAKAVGAPDVLIPDTFAHERLRPVGRPRPELANAALPGAMCFDCSSPLLEGTWLAVLESAQCALSSAHAIAEGERHVYSLCRPPGHHAGANFYGGFCYLNNAAIAARHLQSAGRRLAVLDLDIHHGNGTQAIFWEDPCVLVISIHQHPSFGYPYFTGYPDEVGGPEAPDANCNLTLDKGCDDFAFARILEVALERISAFGADTVVVPLGLDGHVADPLSETALTSSGYTVVGAALRQLDLPLLIVQEGGYATEVLRESLRSFLGAVVS